MAAKSIKYLFLIFLGILLYSVSVVYGDSQNYWLRLSSPVTKTLNRCIFTDTLNGWVVGDSGTIIHTSNGGVNWVDQTINIDYPISNVYFLNPRLGWCIANNYLYNGTSIFWTTNGGALWNFSRYPDTTVVITDIHYIDSLTGLVCGYQGVVFKTTNAGINWAPCVVENNVYKVFPMFKMTFYDSQNGVSCGGILDIAGLVWQTTNGGAFWYTSDTLPVPIVNVKYFGGQNIYSCGGEYDFGVFVNSSSNAGSSWNNMNLGYIGVGQSIGFRTPNECWVPMGYLQNWALSIDSGHTWRLVPVPDSAGVFDVVFFNQNLGWAFGQYGSIFKYNPVIGITNYSSVIKQFKLYQNYPNPFNPTTIIKFEIPASLFPSKAEAMNVTLKVYDILGREIASLIPPLQEGLKPGIHEVVFDGRNLSSGIYFYRLQVTSDGSAAINYTESKKMIILK